MEDILDTPEPVLNERKFFSSKAALWATLIGGPLALAYIISHNYRSLGKPDSAVKAWVYILLFFVLVCYLPEEFPVLDNVVSIGFPLLSALCGQVFVANYQLNAVKNYLGPRNVQPWGITMIVAVIGLFLTLGTALLILYFTTPEVSRNF